MLFLMLPMSSCNIFATGQQFWDDVTWIKFLAPLTRSLWPFLSLSVRGYCPRQLHSPSFSPAQCIFLSFRPAVKRSIPSFSFCLSLLQSILPFSEKHKSESMWWEKIQDLTPVHTFFGPNMEKKNLLLRKYAMTTKSHNLSHSHIITLGFTKIHPVVCAWSC